MRRRNSLRHLIFYKLYHRPEARVSTSAPRILLLLLSLSSLDYSLPKTYYNVRYWHLRQEQKVVKSCEFRPLVVFGFSSASLALLWDSSGTASSCHPRTSVADRPHACRHSLSPETSCLSPLAGTPRCWPGYLDSELAGQHCKTTLFLFVMRTCMSLQAFGSDVHFLTLTLECSFRLINRSGVLLGA